jgi:hypothetical protein
MRGEVKQFTVPKTLNDLACDSCVLTTHSATVRVPPARRHLPGPTETPDHRKRRPGCTHPRVCHWAQFLTGT